jgi:hypothetical protein
MIGEIHRISWTRGDDTHLLVESSDEVLADVDPGGSIEVEAVRLEGPATEDGHLPRAWRVREVPLVWQRS